jgi:hypothetical protein
MNSIRFARSFRANSLTLDALENLRDEVTSGAQRGPGSGRVSLRRALLNSAPSSTGLPPKAANWWKRRKSSPSRSVLPHLKPSCSRLNCLLGRANALRDEITSRRSVEFTSRLFERSSSILAADLWIDGLVDVPRIFQRLNDLAVSSWNAVYDRATSVALQGSALWWSSWWFWRFRCAAMRCAGPPGPAPNSPTPSNARAAPCAS